MDKTELFKILKANHQLFISFIDELEAYEFSTSLNEKWSPAEQLEHIYLSVKPFANGLKTAPKFLLKTSFGKSKVGSKTYDEVVSFYNSFLNKGKKAPPKYIPKKIEFSYKEELINKLHHQLENLIKAITKFSEKELDQYRLPHPLMGKLTVREMIYFTCYHVNHHLIKTKENLNP